MTYQDISRYRPCNEVDKAKVDKLVESMLANGWQGCPVLVYGDELLTGSHRLAALKRIEEMYHNDEIDEANILDEDIAEDVTDIVEENWQKYVEEHGYDPDFDKSDIGWLLAGSWVEDYKDEIAEW